MVKVLIEAEYNKQTDNPTYWFLDTVNQDIEKLIIPSTDASSCFKQKGMTEQEIRQAIKINKGEASIEGIDFITQYDLLQKKEVEVARVRMKNARAVGKFRLKTSNEGGIKRVYRHAFDRGWYYGMPYNNRFAPITIPTDSKWDKQFQEHDADLRSRLLQWTFAPIPNIKRMAVDIEVQGRGNVIPDVHEALEPIISCAFAYSDDRPGVVFVLKSAVRDIDNNHKRNQMLAEQIQQGVLQVKMCDSEGELLEHVFQRMGEQGYPLILTYYGREFDLPYLYNRAKQLNFRDNEIPFSTWLQVRVSKKKDGKSVTFRECRIKFKNKLHLDLFVHLDQPVIKNYVHKNRYLDTSKLDGVSQALLGLEKYKYEGTITDMAISDLVWYNYWDSHLTMELTKFNNEITMKIILMFMRLGRQTFTDAAHRAIGSKILNLFQGYMIENNILIPTSDELKVFGQIESGDRSRSNKSFEGATILEVEVGDHYNTDTLDFSSLYPSVMCNNNVSFETMNCGHKTCKEATDNRVPSLTHYTCKIYKGIMPKLISLVKDIRLAVFKPMSKKDPEAFAVEQALKVYINASFGVTGYENFGLYCPPAGESTAAFGRDALMRLQAKVDTMGIRIIFGDTDSVGLAGATPEQIKELEQWSLNDLDIELAHEYHTKVMIMCGKKTYFYVDEDNEVVIKGLMGKKRNVPTIVRNCFDECLEAVKQLCINDAHTPDAIRDVFRTVINKYYQMIWDREGEISDYSKKTQMTKRISDYVKTTPKHVKVAKKLADWKRQSAGQAYTHMSEDALVPAGTYVEYIEKAKTGKRRMNLETVTKPGIQSETIPVEMATKDDITPELVHATLISTMNQILKALGIDESEVVIRDPEAPTLDAFF